MIFFQTDGGMADDVDYNATVAASPPPADGGMDNEAGDEEDLSRINRQVKMVEQVRQRHQDILTDLYGGNSEQKFRGEQSNFPNLSTIRGVQESAAMGGVGGRDYYRMTGRINSGIGTGDPARRDAFGNIKGYGPVGSPLHSGSNAMDQPEWNSFFGKKSALPDRAIMGPPISVQPQYSAPFGQPHENAYAYIA